MQVGERGGRTPGGPEALAVARRPGILQTFVSLRHRNYRYLWLGQLMSSAGQWMETVAQGWLILELTDSAFFLGLVNLFRAGPMLFFSLVGGVAADRIDRRKLLIASQVGIMATALLMAILITTGLIQVWHVFTIVFFSGVSQAVNQPTRQAMIPNLVPKEDLMNAIALNSAAMNVTRILGPSAAGILVSMVGVSGAYYFKGMGYIWVLFMSILIELPFQKSGKVEESVWKNMSEGFSYIWHNQTVLTLILLALVPMVFGMPYSTLMPIFARDILSIGASGLGLLMSAPGVGALAGALAIAALGDFRRKGWVLLAGAFGFGALLVLFAGSGWLPLSMLLLVGVGCMNTSYMAITNTLLQTTVPDDLRGRVMAVYMLDRGLMPLGSMIAGSIAALAGAPLAMAAMGSICALLAVGCGVFAPHIRKL